MITEDNFIETYQPKDNNLADHGGWDGKLFDTSKEEMDFVLSYANDFLKQKHVWTWIETDGKQYISAGYHLVNRMGYFITEKPWETGVEEIECDDWLDYLPTYEFNKEDFSDEFWRDNGGSQDQIVLFVKQNDLSIRNENDLQTFLLDHSQTTNSFDEAVKDALRYQHFEFRGELGEGVAFVLDVFETWEDQEKGNVTESFIFYIEQYQE